MSTRRRLVAEVVRFGLVGVANTAVYYLTYRLLLLVMPYLAAHVLAWGVSVVGSFLLNCWFTFRVRPTLRRFLLFPASTLVNFVLTTVGSAAVVSGLGWDERYATVLMGIAAIPATFVVTRFVLRPGPTAPRP